MKTRQLTIIGIVIAIAISITYASLAYNQEIKLITGMMNSDEEPQPQRVLTDPKFCAELFDKTFDTWKKYVDENYGGPGQPTLEPLSVVEIISGWEGGQEFRDSDCRFRVNDWAYLVKRQDIVWGNIDWPNLEPFKPKPEPEPEPIAAFGNSVPDFEKATSGTMSWAKMPTYIPSEYILKDIRLVDNGGFGSMINLIYLKDAQYVSNSDTIDDLRKNGLVITYTQGEKLDDFDWNTFVKDYVNEKPEIRAMSEQNEQVMLIEKPDLKKPLPGKSHIKIGYNDVFVMSLNLDANELEKILWSIVENEN